MLEGTFFVEMQIGLNVATNLRARARRASTRLVTRRERAAFFLVPPLALSPVFSFFVVPFRRSNLGHFGEIPFFGCVRVEEE